LWGGVRGGGRSWGTETCPNRASHESGPRRIERRRLRNVSSRARCALHRRKPSGSYGGTYVIAFRRQARISVAKFGSASNIADFACHAKRIVIEVDGSQHALQSAADQERTKALKASGYQVLRYWNNDVLTNIDGVLEDILSKMNSDPHP
jgi:very-short-patch-repair endonuclease